MAESQPHRNKLARYKRSTQLLGFQRRAAAMLLALQLASVAFEGIGVGMLIPIMQFVSSKGDLAALQSEGGWWPYIVDFFAAIDVRPTLLSLLSVSVAAIVARQAFTYASNAYRIRMRERLVHNVRCRLFSSFIGAELSRLETQKVGEIVNEITIETGRAIRSILQFVRVIGSLLLCLVYGAGLYVISSGLTVISLGVVVATILVVRPLLRKSERVSFDIASANRNLAAFVAERLRNVRFIRLNGWQDVERDTFRSYSDRQMTNVMTSQLLAERVTAVVTPVAVCLALILFYIGIEVIGVALPVLAGFVLIVLRLLPVVREIMSDIQAMLSNLGSLESVEGRLLELERGEERSSGNRRFPGLTRELKFESVHFAHATTSGSPALSDIQLTIPAGTFLAIVGPSGAGKSTLVDLIPGLRCPYAGDIKFDGISISEFDHVSLRQQIAFVPQQTAVFDISIREHISYGRTGVADDEIQRASEMANVREFVERLPNGYETRLGEDGVFLSGGQRQRIDIARALVKQPSILILDEPTSQQDLESARALQDALERIHLDTDITIIVIAHSAQFLNIVDMAAVLENGRILRTGSPGELPAADRLLAGVAS